MLIMQDLAYFVKGYQFMWPYRLLVLEEETTSLLAKHSKNIACGTLFLLYCKQRVFSVHFLP